LYARPGHYKTKMALISAKYAGLQVEIPVQQSDDTAGKIPVLETEQGCIFSSMAIARYIARMRRDVSLYGQNLLEGGMIDSWIEFCMHELEVPLCAWTMQVSGVHKEMPEVMKQAKEDVKKALNILNNHLLVNTYMVGHQITLADVCVCCSLLDGLKYVFDENFRQPFGNVMRWFNLCVAQKEFADVLGKIEMCAGAPSTKVSEPAPKKEGKKDAAPKKEKEPAPKKEGKKEAKKEEAKGAPAAKKESKKDKKDEKKAESAETEAKEKTPEELAAEKKAKLKKVIKEGGKRGVEIEGAADLGGLKFFSTSVDEPEGDIEMLVECVKAMNAEVDPSAEERKGGSGAIGKMIFSAGTEQLAILAYVPEAHQGDLSGEEWLKKVLGMFSGEVVSAGKDICTGRVLANSDKGVFPLKIREPMIIEANNFLRKRGLFPEDDDDDDEMVFGDDDFPS